MGRIRLVHGDGGKDTSQLINEIFYKNFRNELLVNSLDASVFEIQKGNLAYTTDSFVVKPIIFSGGDIGKLSICGTVNDLVVSGAKPLYLSCGFIIEEGFDIKTLEYIVQSMGEVCKAAGVKIITGDTKVVEKGAVDGLFINTSGIGVIQSNYRPKEISQGDKIIITGGIGEHGATIAVERYDIDIRGNLRSDCMPLTNIQEIVAKYSNSIKLMKDPTRGGLATILNEIVEMPKLAIHLVENHIPIQQEVRSLCDLLGLDPFYLACEGRMVLVVDGEQCHDILDDIRKCEGCRNSEIIGSFMSKDVEPLVLMDTPVGGQRILGPLQGGNLPRIC